MNIDLIQSIPAIRMLASRNQNILASLVTDSCKDELAATEKFLEIQLPDENFVKLKIHFDEWFKKNEYPPKYVKINNSEIIQIYILSDSNAVLAGKICIVTGSGQGFGAGIAEMLFEKGANIVIADINETIGRQKEESLNGRGAENKALFIKTDVSKPESVNKLVENTVLNFGGLDIMISNAGILFAGGLDEMTSETFKKMSEVNYFGFFYCAKYASQIMKIQTSIRPKWFCDIIQINSKSGLQGSKKNFAYAGGKFGGIGLTQSFAMELMPHYIKVNAICPGNYFEGPLWSDPENGLFVQYLNAGKVPGAKTIEDVKKYYEKQVPAGRGCQVKDVVKAIIYAIDQDYETGQAIPVTGGQIMLH